MSHLCAAWLKYDVILWILGAAKHTYLGEYKWQINTNKKQIILCNKQIKIVNTIKETRLPALTLNINCELQNRPI